MSVNDVTPDLVCTSSLYQTCLEDAQRVTSLSLCLPTENTIFVM